MKCPVCGTDNPNGSAFCKSCGGKIVATHKTEPREPGNAKTIKCPKCGAENAKGSVYCMKCRTKLSEEESINLDGVKNVIENVKAKVLSLPKHILACWGAALIILLIIIIVGVNNANTINLNEYVTFKSSGYDGYGKGTAVIDWDKIEDKYKSKVKFTQSAQRELGSMAKSVSPFSYLEDSVAVDVKNNKNLKNGDTVNYTWKVSDDLDKYVKVKLKYKDGTFNVKDLKKLDAVDVFENLKVGFSGIAPKGKISIEYTGNDLSENDFIVESGDSVSNGDTIVVKLDERILENYAEREGKVPAKMSQEYTVSGLDTYLTSVNDINATELEPLINQGYDVIKANAANWNEETTIFEGSEYIGTILLSPKIQNEVNRLYLIYKIRVHEKYSNDEKSFDGLTDYFWYIQYNKVLVGEDGKISCDINTYNRPSDLFEIDSGISSGWFSNYTWKYYGYDSINSLRKNVIDKNLADYVPEDNLNVPSEVNSEPEPSEAASAEVTEEETKEETIGKITVKVNHLNIRPSASKDGESLGQLSEGDTRTAYEKKEAEGYTWYRIGENEWIADGNGEWISIAE